MNDSRKNSDQENERSPETDNEAIKNSGDVNADKLQKSYDPNKDAPDYPHYPASEDLLNPSNDVERADVDVESITRAGNIAENAPSAGSVVSQDGGEFPTANGDDDEDDLGIVPGTEADVTKEDLLLLGPKDQDMDLGEDEAYKDKGFPLEQTGEDLDVPGEELDDSNEELGEEDEENNYYSLGGDNHENLEEDQAGQE